ncbi:cysteine protease [Cavenderia fasciculata]|uniref:Cysteine protease n=1 Tax=Cavenderia fasciculata TaxID=261658 RepID=F4Q5Z9_CACFS|nr:cysteine protease [Cavenderia fasciculata]EGG17408.1 cysteine protease [Cavenderia fasciculata]|eukprot:XP_004355892.1 cysteine protease [Cavenderia fasciculata]
MYRKGELILLGLILIISVVKGGGSGGGIFFEEEEYRKEFEGWIHRFEKSYESFDFLQRFAVFKTNMDYVHEWNSKKLPTVLELNQFADITNQEYRRLYLGTRINARHLLGTPGTHEMSNNFGKVFGDDDSDSSGATVDWRAKGAVSPIKNQGQCGSCWSFSTTGSVEGAHYISTGKMVPLSEQNLVDCSGSEGNMGCQGGLMNLAFDYIIKNEGIDTEDSYPYSAETGKKCLFNKTNVGATISSYKNITSGDESNLADAVKNAGPVSVAIDASHNSFQLYSHGIYYEKDCSSVNLDHGVLVVGYGSGDPSSLANNVGGRSGPKMVVFNNRMVKTPSSNGDYWIVKNSWGSTWGSHGFIFMSMNRDNNCGIATSASYPIV